MKLEEVINQLECLKIHCEDMKDDEDPEDVWHKDVAALKIAIKIIEKVFQE